MGYEFFELYPVNPLQLARYRETFSPGGAKDDRPDAGLLSSCSIVIAIGSEPGKPIQNQPANWPSSTRGVVKRSINAPA